MPVKPITGWYPVFDESYNFKECTGWDVVLKDIFTVLVTRPGSRQWQPEFGCRLLDMLFEVNLNEEHFVNAVKEAFYWLPYVSLSDVQCKITPMQNGRGNKAVVSMKVKYDGETKNVSFKIPGHMDLLNGSLYGVGVIRKKDKK